jgi:hypothetical protein
MKLCQSGGFRRNIRGGSRVNVDEGVPCDPPEATLRI